MQVLECEKTILGNEIQLLGFENCKNPTLIIGVFHGDEPQGKYLIEKYLQVSPLFQTFPTGDEGRGIRSILFVPCLNPDGLQKGTRTNANGVDLNRNFPTKNWELTERNEFFGGESPASEIETRFIIDVIEKYQPKEIVTLHAPFKIVNYDGNAKDLAEKISAIIDYPVEGNIGYPTPGSFGTYAGLEKKIPTITLELDETCPVEELISPVHKIFDMLFNS